MLIYVGERRFFASLRCALNDKRMPYLTLNVIQVSYKFMSGRAESRLHIDNSIASQNVTLNSYQGLFIIKKENIEINALIFRSLKNISLL